MSDKKKIIMAGKTALGIEFGSTRIKGVLVDENNEPLAAGSYAWENQLQNGIWTYSLEEVWAGLKSCYLALKTDVKNKYDVTLTKVGTIGISAMMHGYLVFDAKEQLLVPFRTWRNTMTEAAAAQLTNQFSYHIPQRWSIAHLYQAILNQEPHVKEVAFMTTLAGYVHWKLTGERVLGIGDASGMFPIDIETSNFDEQMLNKFDQLNQDREFEWNIRQVLPKVLTAGTAAGVLTQAGAALLDPEADLSSQIPLCPPEGDAGTGMAATNSVKIRTGNVSAGTSVFAMVVLEKELAKVYPEIDLVTTPDGSLVGMVHCNNCTSDLNAWVNLFHEFASGLGMSVDANQLFSFLYHKALAEGDADSGKLMAYNYFSGETMTGFFEGRPLFVRMPDSHFNLANFMRTHLFTALGALKVGMDILLKEERITIDKMLGHGGFFKTKGIGERILAAAIDAPVTVMETAGEGGAWGIAVLANYLMQKGATETLGDYLDKRVFAQQKSVTAEPEPSLMDSFEEFMIRYRAGLSAEQAAVDALI